LNLHQLFLCNQNNFHVSLSHRSSFLREHVQILVRDLINFQWFKISTGLWALVAISDIGDTFADSGVWICSLTTVHGHCCSCFTYHYFLILYKLQNFILLIINFIIHCNYSSHKTIGYRTSENPKTVT